MHSTPVPVASLPLAPSEKAEMEALRKESTSKLQFNMRLELTGGAGPIGTEAAEDFFRNTVKNATITRPPLSRVSQMVHSSKQFSQFNKEEVQPQITKAVRASAATGVLNYRVMAEPGGMVQVSKRDMLDFGGGLDDLTFNSRALHFLIGSFQGVDIFLADFKASETTRRYEATLIYHFFDHFGIDDSDLRKEHWYTLGHGTDGQQSFWILQRERHPGHMPYVEKVELVSVEISDSF